MNGHQAPGLVLSASGATARRKDKKTPAGNRLRILFVWIERARQRRGLAALSDRSLKDIGISRCDTLHEAQKPFWRG